MAQRFAFEAADIVAAGACMSHFLLNRYGNGAIPASFMTFHGTADDVVPISDGRDAKEASLNGSEWVEIEGAGHSFDGHHDEVSRIVGDWIERVLNGG